MLQRLDPADQLIGRVKASGCFVVKHLGHRAMIGEGPALAGRHVASGDRRLDSPPGAVGRETDHGIAWSGAGAAALAGRVGIGCRADRDPPAGWREPRQWGRAVTPFADRLRPLVVT